jgi:ABC-type antimicrobial peptide transport system permease subunit
VKMVLRGAIFQAGLGLAIGVPIAMVGAHYMTDQLYQVRSYDPLSLAIAIMVLSASAAIAGFIPARRAANIEPMVALRTE